MSSDQQAAMEQEGAGTRGEQAPAMSAKKLWRVLRAVHLVLVKGLGKHQPKLAALGVHLHHLLSKRYQHGLASVREHPALTYLSALSCRSVDPAAAVHPYPRARGAHGVSRGASLSSLSCRSMDPSAAVYQYQYRPREVEFSCSSTPLHRRRRAQRRGMRLQQQGAAGHEHGLPEYSSAAGVTRLFELLDVAEATDDDDAYLAESATPWAAPAAGGPAPRQVRITDSPFPAREEDADEGRGVVDRRADEFIMWFHDQLRMQQQQRRRPAARERTTYLVR